MDTRFLESFVQVAELGSIAEAARSLDLTPTAVSLRIKTLERQVGTALVERAGRNVRPTQAGVNVLAQARLILHEVRNFGSLATCTELPAGRLTLGATPSAIKGMLPPILKKWVDRYPSNDIFIEPGPTAVLYDKVCSGEVDAAILVHPLFDIPKSLCWQTLRVERLVLLTRADIPSSDPFEIIRRNPFIRYDRRVVGGKMAHDYLRSHGLHPQPRLELDGIDYIADLVREGLGVSVLPDWVNGVSAQPTLRRHPLPEPVPTRSMGLIWLRANVRARLVEAFLELAQEAHPPSGRPVAENATAWVADAPVD
jgi:DNA-binding transcriptional LysR family regulator